MNLRYLCLVYEEASDVDALPQPATAAIAAEDRDELGEFQQSGHYVASARLQPAEMAATVRVRNGSVYVSNGSEAETKQRLAQFYLIDAWDLNDAIRIAAKMTVARRGWIEVRPLVECDPG